MPRRTPTTTQTVYAIGPAKERVRARLAADGRMCPDDIETMLLLDVVAYYANKADLDRRERNAREDYGDDVPGRRLQREMREVEQEYAHIRELIAA